MGTQLVSVIDWGSDQQGIIAEINTAIGATGVVSQECKMVVQQYAEIIIELLEQQVWHIL